MLKLKRNFTRPYYYMGINYVPVGSWTMEKEGTQRFELTGKDDKQQLTTVFDGSIAGDFLSLQLIHQGKMTRCIPKVKFPADWDVTNYWSDEGTMTKEDLKSPLMDSSLYRQLIIVIKF